MIINKKIKNLFLILVLLVVLFFFLIFAINLFYKYKCVNLDIKDNNYIEAVEDCYVAGNLDKERKDFLINKYKTNKVLNNLNGTNDIKQKKDYVMDLVEKEIIDEGIWNMIKEKLNEEKLNNY